MKIHWVNLQWYNICSDISNLRKLMKYVDKEEQYDVVYTGFSFETHGYNAGMGVNVSEDGYFMELIRNPKKGESTFKRKDNRKFKND